MALALAGAVVVGGLAGYRYFSGYGQASPYRTARVERGPLTASVSATGSLNAVAMVLVGSELKVPNAALRFRPPGAEPAARDGVPGSKRPAPGATGVVWILGRDGRPAPVHVTLGVTDGTWTEVAGGDLEVGHTVLVGLESSASPTLPSPGPRFRL